MKNRVYFFSFLFLYLGLVLGSLQAAVQQSPSLVSCVMIQVAITHHNMAVHYQDQGAYNKAEEFYQKVLAIYEKELPPGHPDLATTYHNMAGSYQAQGAYDKAEQFYQKDLAITLKALPPDHPDLATTYHSMAGLYQDQGSYERAEQFYKKALAIEVKSLPSDHPHTKSTRQSLARVRKVRMMNSTNEERVIEAVAVEAPASESFESALLTGAGGASSGESQDAVVAAVAAAPKALRAKVSSDASGTAESRHVLDGFPLLIKAVIQRNLVALQAEIDAGADINSIAPLDSEDHPGWTALHFAVALNRGDMINILLAQGADPNSVSFYGNNTPLHYAAADGRPLSFIRLLVEAGARTDFENDEGKTALTFALKRDERDKQVVMYLRKQESGVGDRDDERPRKRRKKE